ncbi:CaiB/BaiF CoA-transferase family protein [Phyllobacterium sp. 0TCS1.6C]|uniref:CaiB/BaiF CoA transferase family protein n=1 Tax=unclassified Phyllobacterium TaxID=2638441 RepID=UPI002263CF0B|nr:MULTISPECIES: CaiB/BaiF CoA-transferase family protein [unclassified Phyllobacterium]MCX8281124.1 CaiB/BaiF CoA-transferase family protein [Phyllobacterium sp. 0TCS1.6C]MCX8294589.1 CaiB/BaiF CoA-transferase family protein [Phyllobacterium sp. 0TCS1.6A]
MTLLSGVKILSFNHFLAGPLAAQTLADLGADVIAVEPIEGAFQRNWAVANRFVEGDSVNHLATGRNKRSIAVDLKNPQGLAAVKKLVATADVVMENFRPGTMEKLGLGYEVLKAINPGIIYAVATGFGGDGPYRDRPGQDLLLQAMSGLAARTGRADGAPTPVGAVIVDQHAASLYAMAILAALFAKAKTGAGRLVEVNLYLAAIDLQVEPLTAWLNGAASPTSRGPSGIASWFSPGPYGIHATADGHLALSMAAPRALAAALGIKALEAFTDADSFARREEITRLVADTLKEKATSDWLPGLEAGKIWHAPVQDYEDLRADPQLEHMQAFKTVEGAYGQNVTMVMHPARYDGKSPEIKLVPQRLGAQTREVLGEAGYSDAEIEALFAASAVGVQ